MKRIVSLILVLGLVLSFVGCKEEKDRELYEVNLNKYVDLGEYKGLKVDTGSNKFKETEKSVISSDVANNDLYVVKESGKVEKGDTVNIDYTGKKDGVAFQGGTAEKQNLLIGSGQFIEGFEDGLIGKEIGSTVDLDLTFPENYGNEELNGAKVVFTVKINYAKSTKEMAPEEFYKSIGFETIEEYYEDVKNRAIEQTLSQAVVKKSKIKKYPKDDLEELFEHAKETVEQNLYYSYQITLEDYLTQVGQTEEAFNKTIIDNQVKPLMDQQMLWYAILDKEKISLTEKDIDKKIKELLKQSGDTEMKKSDVLEYFGEWYVENIVVSEKVFKFLKDNAVIS